MPVTDIANGCFRSSHNYPALVAADLDTKVEDHSCGGATTADLSRSQHPDVPPQLDALGADTRLVTFGMGGNDGQVFNQLVNRCPSLRSQDTRGAPCAAYMKRNGPDLLLSTLRNTGRRLTKALREVKKRAPDAQVLVVGYPQLVSTANRCQDLPLARGDYAYGEKVNRALADALERAAQATGSTYVDVWKASQGHDICSEDPWINGSTNDQQRAARYHPFAVEQEAVAKLVVAAVGS